MDMKKQTDIDIIAELSKLVDAHVHHYKEDFEMDRRLIAQAAKATLSEDKTLIWFCRDCGTHCLRESQAFIRDSREHTTLRFYAEQSGEDITARVVVPKRIKGGKIFGDVFDVSFQSLAYKIANDSIAPMMTHMTFEDGHQQEVPFHKSLRQAEYLVQEHGKIASLRVIPADKEALADILLKQKMQRDRLPEAKTEVLAPLPVSEYRKYQAVKQEHPDALVCYAQKGYFELYGEDAKKAAPILGTKVLDKKVRGLPSIPVTGFKEEMWVSASKKLWRAGEDVFLSKDGTTFKELKGADFIPVGSKLPIAGVMSRIEKVDYPTGKVFLSNIENPEHPVKYQEPIDYVRAYVEDAGLSAYENREMKAAEKSKSRSSIREKLTAAKKEQSSKKDAPAKIKGKDLEL